MVNPPISKGEAFHAFIFVIESGVRLPIGCIVTFAMFGICAIMSPLPDKIPRKQSITSWHHNTAQLGSQGARSGPPKELFILSSAALSGMSIKHSKVVSETLLCQAIKAPASFAALGMKSFAIATLHMSRQSLDGRGRKPTMFENGWRSGPGIKPSCLFEFTYLVETHHTI